MGDHSINGVSYAELMAEAQNPLKRALDHMKHMKAGEALLYAMYQLMPICMNMQESMMDQYAQLIDDEQQMLTDVNKILAELNSIEIGKDTNPNQQNPPSWLSKTGYKDLTDPYKGWPWTNVQWNPIVQIFQDLGNLFGKASHFPGLEAQLKSESGEFSTTEALWEQGLLSGDTQQVYDAIKQLGNDIFYAWDLASAQPPYNPSDLKTDNGSAIKTFQDDLNSMTTTVNGQQSSTQAELKYRENEYNSTQDTMKNLGQQINQMDKASTSATKAQS